MLKIKDNIDLKELENKLPYNEFNILKLRFIENYSIIDISKTLDIDHIEIRKIICMLEIWLNYLDLVEKID